MELLDLSITYIDIANTFQALHPNSQTEFLQLIQDEYTLDSQPISYDEVETREDYEYFIVYHIVSLFYIHYNDIHFTTVIENKIHELYEVDKECLPFLLHLGTSLKQYLYEVS